MEQKNYLLRSMDQDTSNNALKNTEEQLNKNHSISITVLPNGSTTQVLLPESSSPANSVGLSKVNIPVRVKAEKREAASSGSSQSIKTIQSTELDDIKLEKKQRLWDFFTMVTSILYSMVILILGMVCYFGDLFVVSSVPIHLSEIFNLYLCIVGIGVISWLLFDIQCYISSVCKYKEAGCFTLEELKLVTGPDGEINLEIPLPDAQEKLPEYYCFSTGRHTGSIFLKLGAGIFCFGHLIHTFLNIAKESVYFMDDNSTIVDECASGHVMAFKVIYPIFSFLQLFMIFKFSNVIVNRSKPFARFALMHCLSASLCFWIYTILNETLDSLVVKYFHKHDEGQGMGMAIASYQDIPDCNINNDTRFGIINSAVCVLEKRYTCSSNSDPISQSLFQTSDFLYPFSIEFSILTVAVWYIMWSNIGKVEEHINSIKLLPSLSSNESTEGLHRTAGHKEAMVIYADCASSNTGLFAGFFVLAATAVMIIIHFCFSYHKTYIDASLTVAHTTELVVYSSLIFATVAAYVQVARLEVNPHPISFLDDMLLFICTPSFVLYSLVSLVPDFYYIYEDVTDAFYAITNSLTLLQVMIQTPLIVDGLRRCSDSRESQQKLPGRSTVMFLIVVNLAAYLLETCLLQSTVYSSKRMNFYGTHIWTILTHITMPLCIFYRFHSAVALVDI